MDGVAITAVIVSGAVGVTGASWPMVSWLSERHGGERRRVIEGRGVAYLSLLACFDRDKRDERYIGPEVEAKVVLYGSPQMQNLYVRWLDRFDERPVDETRLAVHPPEQALQDRLGSA